MNTSRPHLNLRPVLAFLLMMAPASTIHAQSAAPRHTWFVTASVLRSRDRPTGFEDRSSDPLFQTTGWDAAAGLGMGAFVSDRWSVRAEVEIPQRGQTEYWTSPPQQPPLQIIEWTRQEITRRHTTAAGLLGFHVRRSSRIHPSFLVGATVAHLHAEETFRDFFFAGSPWRTVYHSTSTSTHLGVITGIDVETGITSAFALVAQARGSIVAAGNESTVDVDSGIGRIGVGVRWMF